MHGFDEVNDAWEIIAQREHLRKNETPRRLITRSAAAARAIGGRVTAEKEERPDEDEDEDETDSDEIEEKVEKLRAELNRREKKNGPSVKMPRDIHSPEKTNSQTKVGGDDQSTSSSETD